MSLKRKWVREALRFIFYPQGNRRWGQRKQWENAGVSTANTFECLSVFPCLVKASAGIPREESAGFYPVVSGVSKSQEEASPGISPASRGLHHKGLSHQQKPRDRLLSGGGAGQA